MSAEIKKLYYLENFKRLIDFVFGHYKQILNDDVLHFYKQFNQLPENAQQMFVRIVSRKKIGVRRSKLHYDDIAELNKAIEVLLKENMLIKNDQISFQEISPMFTKHELLSLDCDSSIKKKLKKDDLIFSLLDTYEEEVLLKTLFQFDAILSVKVHYEWSVIKLLFFGNLHQDLSEFVIRDLGHQTYESYVLSFDQFAFKNMKELDDYLSLHGIGEDIQTMIETKSSESLLERGESLLSLNLTERSINKKYKIINRIAKYFEHQKNDALAIKFYRESKRHPCRERLARIYYKLKKIDQVKAICEEILADKFCQNEYDFAYKFLKKVNGEQKTKVSFNDQEIFLERIEGLSVENLVVQNLSRNGFGQCCFVENRLFNALFGLYFWDIIFSPFAGAFLHPFQRGPTDLFKADFVDNRKIHIESRLDELVGTEEFYQNCLTVLNEKSGVANYFVDWSLIDQPLLQLSCQCISVRDLKLIFERMLNNLKENKSGFPDLICFEKNTYRLIEVKGPGDKLQPNQIRWMQYFEEMSIPYQVLYVKWKNV